MHNQIVQVSLNASSNSMTSLKLLVKQYVLETVLKKAFTALTNRLIGLQQLDQIYIVLGRTNLRKEIDGLATLIQEKFDMSPFKLTILSYYISYWKTPIYNGHQGEAWKLRQQQLTWLLGGLSVEATIH